MVKKALEMQLNNGPEVRRKSANTTTNTIMVQAMPHSLSSAATVGFSSLNNSNVNH